MPNIHKTAIISEESIIGHGTQIWVNVQISGHVKIGSNCIFKKDIIFF